MPPTPARRPRTASASRARGRATCVAARRGGSAWARRPAGGTRGATCRPAAARCGEMQREPPGRPACATRDVPGGRVAASGRWRAVRFLEGSGPPPVRFCRCPRRVTSENRLSSRILLRCVSRAGRLASGRSTSGRSTSGRSTQPVASRAGAAALDGGGLPPRIQAGSGPIGFGRRAVRRGRFRAAGSHQSLPRVVAEGYILTGVGRQGAAPCRFVPTCCEGDACL
jgi:hypothetical protein